MKNIKVLETLAVCLFSMLLFSFAVIQEKNLRANTVHHTITERIKQVEQNTSSIFNFKADLRPTFDILSNITSQKVISSIVIVVAVISFLIILVGFLFYNMYNIRP